MRHLRAPLIVAFVGAATIAHVQHPAAQVADRFTLTSPAFADGGIMPNHYVGVPSSRSVSPPLAWSAPPPSTKQFALVMENVSVVGAGASRPFVHWVVYGIPGSATGLPVKLPAGIVTTGPLAGTVQGETDVDIRAKPAEILPDQSDASWAVRWGPRLGAQVTTLPRPAGVPRYFPPMRSGEESRHRYVFTLYAIDEDLQLPASLRKADLIEMIKDHIVGEATLTGIGPR